MNSLTSTFANFSSAKQAQEALIAAGYKQVSIELPDAPEPSWANASAPGGVSILDRSISVDGNADGGFPAPVSAQATIPTHHLDQIACLTVRSLARFETAIGIIKYFGGTIQPTSTSP